MLQRAKSINRPTSSQAETAGITPFRSREMVRRRTILLAARPVKTALIETGIIQETHARPLQIHQNKRPRKTSRFLSLIETQKNGHERQPRNRSHPLQQDQQKQHLKLIRQLQRGIRRLALTGKRGITPQTAIAHPSGDKGTGKDSGKHEMRYFSMISHIV